MSGDGTVPGHGTAPGDGTDPYSGGPAPYGAYGSASPYGAAPAPGPAPYDPAPSAAAPYPTAPAGDPGRQGYATPAPYPTAPYPTDPYAQGYAAYPPTSPRNSLATAGLVLGIIAMVVNPLTVLSVLGIVLSGIGLSRAGTLARLGYAPVGRTAATWGLVLSILAFGSSALFKLFVF